MGHKNQNTSLRNQDQIKKKSFFKERARVQRQETPIAKIIIIIIIKGW